ncbi:unnamed protein product [Discosporangium mesarthrocarpum]
MSGGSTHAPSTCLYETLGIPRDASSLDIKKAYRKAALVWHPDKNVGNEEEAHARFQEIQHAYSVLSDPHERNWYDDHRDEILHPERYADGEDGEGGALNLYQYFSSTAFSGFGDDESGFYRTYERVFQEIWVNEADVRSKGEPQPPHMGNHDSPYAQAADMYSFWESFVTKLTFGWVDEYNLSEAPNRKVRRLMEKANNKLRATAKRKYQEQIQALVDFCRRRDKRIIKHKMLLAKQKEEKEERKKAEARLVAEEKKRLKEEWAQRQMEEQEREHKEQVQLDPGDGGPHPPVPVRLADMPSTEEESGEEEGSGRRQKGKGKKGRKGKRKDKAGGGGGGTVATASSDKGGAVGAVLFRCFVCKKDFKSANQMGNHETSKAHRRKMEDLDAELLQEALGMDANELNEDGSYDKDMHKPYHGEEGENEDDLYVDPAIIELELGMEGMTLDMHGSNNGDEDAAPSLSPGVDEVDNERGDLMHSTLNLAERGVPRGGKEGGGANNSKNNISSCDSDSDSSVELASLGKAHVRGSQTGIRGVTEEFEEEEEEEDRPASETTTPVVNQESIMQSLTAAGVSAQSEEGDKGGSDSHIDIEEQVQHAEDLDQSNKLGVEGGAQGAEVGEDKGTRRRRRKAVKKMSKGAGAGITAMAGGAQSCKNQSCRVCGQAFPSRSKLFAHVKASGHALA